jgi:hypothetical protein
MKKQILTGVSKKRSKPKIRQRVGKTLITIITKKLLIYAVILFLSFGCSSYKKDWEKAKELNSLIGYKNFLFTHSEGEYTQKALTAIDSLEWKDASTTADTIKLRNYIKNHSSGAYVANAKSTLDSIEWKEVFSSKDSSKIIMRIKSNPTSKYIEEAKDYLAILKQPAIKIKKVNTVTIYSISGAESYGDVIKFVNNGKISFHPFKDMQSSDIVIEIYRYIPPEKIELADSYGIRVGIAFTQINGKIHNIKKVNMNLNDSLLCNEFGVNGRNIKLVTYAGGGWSMKKID